MALTEMWVLFLCPIMFIYSLQVYNYTHMRWVNNKWYTTFSNRIASDTLSVYFVLFFNEIWGKV